MQANTFSLDLENLEIERTPNRISRLEKFENTIDKLFERLPIYSDNRIHKKAYIRKTKSSNFKILIQIA